MFSLCGAAFAQQAAQRDLGAQIDDIVNREMQKQQIPAATVAVSSGGQVVYAKGFGKADIENNLPAARDTLIRTGSIAKPISAVAAMTLMESGKLDLDAPVQKYCPALPQKQWTVTTRELLAHTSGIRHYKDDEIESTKHYNSMSDGFTIFASDPLLFEPGTKFSYSTYGYTVVGCVIEGASGGKFFDYLREHVLLRDRAVNACTLDVWETDYLGSETDDAIEIFGGDRHLRQVGRARRLCLDPNYEVSGCEIGGAPRARQQSLPIRTFHVQCLDASA